MFGIPRLYALLGIGIVAGLLLSWVLRIDHLRAAHLKQYQAEHAAFVQFQADVKAKTELARISDLAHKAEVERNQETERANHEAEIQHLRTDYAGRVREYAKSHPGSRGSPSVSQPAKPSSDPAPASAEAIVPVADLDICAVNTAAAESWQSWWKSVAEIPR